MSILKLNGSSSGNAQVTVAADAGTPTITLPTASINLATAGSDGQFLKTNGSGTLSFASAGKILQVVHVSTGTRSAVDSTSFTDCTNMTLDITPSSASNKILAIAECCGISSESAALSAASFRLLQDSTVVAMTTNMGAMQDEPLNQSVTFVSLDDATSTSAHTYKVQIKNRQSGDVVLNNTSGGDTSSITLLEVAA